MKFLEEKKSEKNGCRKITQIFLLYNNYKSKTTLQSSLRLFRFDVCTGDTVFLHWKKNTGANDFSREPHILQTGREDVSSPGLQPAGLASLLRALCCWIHIFLGAILVLVYNHYDLFSRLWLVPDLCLMSCDIWKVRKPFRLHLFPF